MNTSPESQTQTQTQRSILVVVPALNEVSTIESVIDRLCAEPPPPGSELRLVVADGGSSDGTIDLVQRLMQDRPQLSLIHNPERIQSAAVNLAASTMGHGVQILVRCDAHALYPAGYVNSLVQTLDRTGADAVVVPMDSVGDTCLQRAIAWTSDTPLGSGGAAHRGGGQSGFIDHGHHAAFRMHSFRRAGGYDATYTHNEDAELDCRQGALGSRIFLDADIRLGYRPRATFRGLWKQYFSYGHGRARTVRRHRGSMRLRQAAVPTHLVLLVLALLVAPVLHTALLWPLFYLAVLAGFSLAMALRQGSLCGLFCGPAAGVMHVSWACGFFWSLISTRERPWVAGEPPRHATAQVTDQRWVTLGSPPQ